MTTAFNKSRARQEILSYLLSYPTISNQDWRTEFGRKTVDVGDLVSLSAAPCTEWFLSWVIAIEDIGNSDKRWLLESVDTGRKCWWTNVGFNIYSKEKITPDWRWTDRQFKVRDRWHRVLQRQDAYLTRPGPTVFHTDGDADGPVTLATRERHDFGGDNWFCKRTFPSYKKLTIAQMTEFYLYADAARDKRKIKPEPELQATP